MLKHLNVHSLRFWTINRSFKTAPVAVIPVNPYFVSKSAEHDVTLTSFVAELWSLDYHLNTMCRIVRRDVTASLVVIPAIVGKMSQENERGARNNPTVGARVKWPEWSVTSWRAGFGRQNGTILDNMKGQRNIVLSPLQKLWRDNLSRSPTPPPETPPLLQHVISRN